jgi:hypothetical protein
VFWTGTGTELTMTLVDWIKNIWNPSVSYTTAASILSTVKVFIAVV